MKARIVFVTILSALLFAPALVFAQEAAPTPPAIPALPADTPWWARLIVYAIGAVATAFIIPWLRQKAKKAAAEARRAETADVESGLQLRSRLKDEVSSFFYDGAASLVEQMYPKIAARVVQGDFKSKDDVKAILYDLGATLKSSAVEHFREGGIDVVAALGDRALDDMIRVAADRVSPFPGKETAAAFLQDEVSNWLLTKGVMYVRDNFLSDEGPGDQSAPRTPTATELS